MIGRSFHLVIVCLLVTSSHQIDFNQLIKSVSGNCGSMLQAYRSSLSDCQSFRSIQSKLTPPFCTSGDNNKLEEVLCGTQSPAGSSSPSGGTNTGGVTSAGVPVQHSSQASAVVRVTTDVTSPTDTTDVSTTVPVKETTDVMSPTDTTVDVGTTVPVNETELQKTFRELGDELTSPLCKIVLNDQAKVLTSFQQACCMLISYKTTLVPTMCTQLEYDKVHDVLCVNVICPTTAAPEHVTNSSQASKEHKEKVLCIIDTQLSSDSCRATARQQAEGESEQGHACETLKSFQTSLDALGCTKQDYDTLYSVICDDVDTTCVREDPLQAVINTLTYRCKSTMSASLKGLKSPGGCSTLESSRTTILTTNLCTLGDYNRLHGILCSQDQVDPNQVLSQGIKFDNAINTVQTKISQSCREILWKDLEKSDFNFDPVCQRLKSSGQGLRAKGLCTQNDLDTLEPAVCIGHRVYDQKEQELRTKIHQVIEELGERCRETMLEQERQMEDTTVESACVKLKASHSALTNTQVCSEAEISQLSPLLCGNTAVLLQVNLLVLLAASIFTFCQVLL